MPVHYFRLVFVRAAEVPRPGLLKSPLQSSPRPTCKLIFLAAHNLISFCCPVRILTSLHTCHSTNYPGYFSPLAATLGTSGPQNFLVPIITNANQFFRVSSNSVYNSNSYFQDGIPDIWKLTNDLNAVDPHLALETVPGLTNDWLQFYTNQLFLNTLPRAWFPVPLTLSSSLAQATSQFRFISTNHTADSLHLNYPAPPSLRARCDWGLRPTRWHQLCAARREHFLQPSDNDQYYAHLGSRT